MGMKNTQDSYGTLTKIFHWSIAIVIYLMLTLGYFLDDIHPKWLQDKSYLIHESTGLTILAIMVIRFIWRQFNTIPDLPLNIPAWQRFGARFVHYAFYVCLILMPLSGWLMATASGYAPNYFGLGSIPMPGIPTSKALAHQAKEFHEFMAAVIISLIVIHMLAAFKHHFINKDDVLRRMLPSKSPKQKPANSTSNDQEDQ